MLWGGGKPVVRATLRKRTSGNETYTRAQHGGVAIAVRDGLVVEALESYGCMTEWYEAQRFMAAVVASPSTTSSMLVAVVYAPREEETRDHFLNNLTERLGQRQHLLWVVGGDISARNTRASNTC